MYPKIDLYNIYADRLVENNFSALLPDVTKKRTLENINHAINVSDNWDTCMDIGGGTGHYLAALASKFKQAILVEVEELDEQKTYENKFNNFKVIHSYIEQYKTDKKIDFILLADLYEHIPDIRSFVAQLSDLQEPGGVVYIMTPNPIRCGPAPESGLYHTRHPNGHIKQYTTQEIARLMENYGYTLLFKLYEEAPFRQKVKHFIYALSRRDKMWQKKIWFQLFRPVLLLIALPLLPILEYLVYRSETKHNQNELLNLTQCLVFKKMVI